MTEPLEVKVNVRAAPFWEWTGFWSGILVALEWGQAQLGLWTTAPSWVTPVLAILPFVIRVVREKKDGVPTSFRRAA